jgi:hypothetical protein
MFMIFSGGARIKDLVVTLEPFVAVFILVPDEGTRQVNEASG